MNNNGWSQEIIDSVYHWQSVCIKLIEPYDKTTDYYESCITVINSLIMLVNTVVMGVSLLQYDQSTRTMRIFLLATSITGELLSGYLLTAKLNNKLKVFTQYTVKLRNFIGILATELSVPVKYRQTGTHFIQKHKAQYQDILLSRPNITGDTVSELLVNARQQFDTGVGDSEDRGEGEHSEEEWI